MMLSLGQNLRRHPTRSDLNNGDGFGFFAALPMGVGRECEALPRRCVVEVVTCLRMPLVRGELLRPV